jgi:hypothetical protein
MKEIYFIAGSVTETLLFRYNFSYPLRNIFLLTESYQKQNCLLDFITDITGDEAED